MARNVTRLQLRTRARQRADVENDSFVSDTEINDLINVYLAELWDILIAASPPDYYSSTWTFATTPGTVSYAVPGDFLALVAAYVVESGVKIPLDAVGDLDLTPLQAPTTAATVEVRYVPAPPTLSTDSDPTTGTLDGVSGWDQLVTCWVARAVLVKDKRDTSQIDAEIAHLEQRIRSNAPRRHAGMPRSVQDVESIGSWPFGQAVAAHQLRAGYLDLYTTRAGWP
jgi:hypothetical protein